MVVTAAATSVLSLGVVPAFADASQDETTGETLGARSDTAAALPGDGALHVLGKGPASASPDVGDVATRPDLSTAYSRVGGPKAGASQTGPRDFAPADSREQGDHWYSGGYGEDGGYGEGGGYGEDGGYGEGGGYGEDGGYGEGSGYGEDGDTPAPQPPTTPPVSPPTTTPPVKSPPASPPVSAPPTTPADIPPRKPPASPPTQPPSLPETGTHEELLAASGIAALLMTSGAILYRRGRAARR